MNRTIGNWCMCFILLLPSLFHCYIAIVIVTFIVTLPVLGYPGTLAQCKLCPGYIEI